MMSYRIGFTIFFLAVGFFACYALLWVASIPKTPIVFGASFSPLYAESLGLDWREAYRAMLTDVNPLTIRIAAPWSEGEATEGEYAFADVDCMMNEAAREGTAVLLVVGQKVPRWPECYFPSWVDASAPGTKEAFLSYLSAIVNRYRHHTALAGWQVENEPFIRFPFGECEQFQESWVAEEIATVRRMDPEKKIVVTDSGELGFWWKAARAGDVLGVTVYRFVESSRGRTWSYAWLPPGWYRLHAWLLGRQGSSFIISELQAEPWEGTGFSPEQLLSHARYARRTGASKAYLWGAEWWYFMKEKKNDARYWDAARSLFAR
jgi:hypothetical protein